MLLPERPDVRGDPVENKAELPVQTSQGEERGDVHHVLRHGLRGGGTRLVRVGRRLVEHAALLALPHGEERGGRADQHEDDDKDSKSSKSKELKCDDNNSGPVTELKVGTEDDQHIVAVDPGDTTKGSTFALVYVHTRGKKGEI